MKVSNWLLFALFICCSSLLFSHSPDEIIILDIEQGELNFENDLIASEYNAALKRLQSRRLGAMSLVKKIEVFIKAGFEHIIPKGLDHIVFVLGLFFSFNSVKSLFYQITSFTVAHSMTLIIAAFGIINLPSSIVEPLIAMSIVWIGFENCLTKRQGKVRNLVVFIFGLLHGLGFASVLSVYGVPKENFTSLLLAFNVGVELGQITVLILAFIITYIAFNKNWKREIVRIPASIAISFIGLFWFIERIVNI